MSASSPIRVLLVDDQDLVRYGFRLVLEAESDLEVVGEAGDGESAIAVATRVHPDVVLMDVRMPGVNGVEATARITTLLPTVRVLVLTTFDIDEYAFGALRAGASGFLLKDTRPAELIAAIRAVHSGDAVISPRITAKLLEVAVPHLSVDEAAVTPGSGPSANPHLEALETLTARELEVLRFIGRGATNSEIASALHLSESTVKSHVGRVLFKQGLRDRVQAVILAYQLGLVGD